MNISFSRILLVYDCFHKLIDQILWKTSVWNQKDHETKRGISLVPRSMYLLRILFGSCTKDIHYRWRAPEVAAFLNCKYLLPNMRSLMPPTPQPLKFVPIKNLKTGVVHLAAFIANLPRRIWDNWKWNTWKDGAGEHHLIRLKRKPAKNFI